MINENHDWFSLTDDQEALLDRLIAKENLDNNRAVPIPLRKDSGPVPLTYAQSRIWFLEQMEPGTSTFIISTAIKLPIPISRSLLNDAFQSVWQRHAILQISVRDVNGTVFQEIGDYLPSLGVVDLSSLAQANRNRVAAEKIKDESERPFDLKTEPLIRLTLVRMQPDEHIILLTTHHIITDGWSTRILLQDLVQAYVQLMQGNSVNLPPLPVQFTDYATWQQAWLASDEIARQLDFWQMKLHDPLQQTELPTDFARPLEQTFAGAQLHLALPAGLCQALQRLSQHAGATMYMTLLAAFKALIQRHVGHDDIIVGSPVSGRQRPELEQLVGLFLNTLVLRTDLSGSPTFLELLGRVRETSLDAFANQDVPFEMLLAKLLPSRDTSRTPFFQIFFNMLEFGDGAPEMDLGVEFVSPPDLNAKFDITLYLENTQHGIDLMLVYNRELYTEARMKDLLQQYKLLLGQIAHDPSLPIYRYSLLTLDAQLSLPDPAAPLDDRWEGPIHARLDAWAERSPLRTAVSDPNGNWTYQQVSVASSRLAQFLHQNGIKTGEVVAIYGYRCAALVSAIMGALKAGATVLILDPAYPEARLEQYLASALPSGWITFAAAIPPPSVQSAALKTADNCQIQLPLLPDMVLFQLKDFADRSPPVLIGPDDTAFLTFTSGSTGDPKGIIGRHRSLTHFYPWMAQRFQVSKSDRFSMLSGLAHDPLQRDIFTAIWAGAEICVPDPDEMWQPGYLAHWVQTTGITVMHLIPSMIHVLMSAGVPTSPSSLRVTLFVGETLKRHVAEQINQAYPSAIVVNLYGTSETQRAVSYHVVTEQVPNQPLLKQEIPIGVGMPGSQLLVLTPELELAGIGELGELYVRSFHLAKGYLQDNEKTNAHFLQNPWSIAPGDRLYGTGDYGRFLPDGQVIFDGRRDMQVNISGFRSELSEIEAVVSTHPAIKSALVTTAPQPGYGAQMAAYITKENAQTELNARQVQAYVREKLPLPMVPNLIIFLDEIPLTPNGKVDYRALPPEDLTAPTDPLRDAPRDHIERLLLSIWRELLPVNNIGIHDDFFALGGHSLLAVQLFSRIEDELGIDLNIRLLFRYPTIAELAQILRTQDVPVKSTVISTEATSSTNLVQVRAGESGQPLFCCVHGAGGHVMFMQKWRHYFGRWSIYGLESPGVDGITWPRGSLESVITDYVTALQAVQPHGPYLLGGYSGGGVLAYEMAQQLQRLGEEVALLVLIDTYHPDVRPRPYSWRERLHRLRHQPLRLFQLAWRRRIMAPLSFSYIMNRYVKRGQRVPLEFRSPLLEHFFISSKQRYKPKPYQGRVLMVRSNEVIRVYDHVSPQLGWEGMITDLQMVKVPGNHFTVVQEPQIRQLSQAIEDAWTGIYTNQTNII